VNDLNKLDTTALLRLRFKDLRVDLRQTSLTDELSALHDELVRRNISFKPHAWLSTEWFSPDGIPGIAIPFYLAHPRLSHLERQLMGEVEGGTRRSRQRILRHEAGHAIDTAFGLRRRARWRELFGPASRRYPQAYRVRPVSRRHVQHLGHWYAQSHPTEDFAETFAVWLQPKARWRRDYAGWPALNKLEYVDELMHEIAGQRARNGKREIAAPLNENQRTLAEHYRRRSTDYDPLQHRYDTWLRRVFTAARIRPQAMPAASYLESKRPALRRRLQRETAAGPYLIEQALRMVTRRSRDLGLVLNDPKTLVYSNVVRLIEQIIHDVLRRNRETYVL
jgi:hypothetical protein